MADPRGHGGAGEGGFTLAEMLAALAILLFGVTALLGTLTASVAQRRSTDARHELAALCERALQRVRDEAVRSASGSSVPTELEFVPLQAQEVADFPGMTWSAHVVADDSRPDLWLVRIEVRWLDQGEEQVQEFLRVVPRQRPLRDRVGAIRETADLAK
ncbi:MAG: type II secretion system GspH family protein [Planctomycetes bacterium]|nr:type II secretion system GspH family protein [Planctomycetota bacterium]MCC7396223.1 type II secretion system protein [Planctomycetota bacterium]